jgi:hypothetical protein
MADSRKSEYGCFRVPERDKGGQLPAKPQVFRSARGWTAYGRNGKYGV